MRQRFPEIAAAVVVVSFALAVWNAFLSAQGLVALGIPVAWWAVIFFTLGSVVSIWVLMDQRKRISAQDRRHRRDGRLAATRNQKIARLRDENERLIRDNRELNTRWALGITQVVPVSVVGQPIRNVAGSVVTSTSGTTEEPATNDPASDQGVGDSGEEGTS
jgi:hypothetical protein